MGNNTFIDKLWEKKWLRFFIGGMGALLLVSAILRVVTVPPPPLDTVITNTTDTKFIIEFSNTLTLETPKELSTYISLEIVDIIKYKDQIAESLKLSRHPQVPGAWVDRNNVYMLTTENGGTFIAYKKDTYFADPQPTPELPLNKEKVQATTKNLITTHNLFQNYVLSDLNPKILSPEGNIPAPTISEANVFQFNVYSLIDNIPLIIGDKDNPPGSVWVNALGSINRFNFYPIPSSYEKVETYTPLSLDTIKKNVNEGLITIIKVETNQDDISATGKISRAIFDSASLEYRQNTTNGYILPYVRFSGTGEDRSGKTYTVEAITPAVKVQ